MTRRPPSWALLAATGCVAVFAAMAMAATGPAPAFDQTIESHVHAWVVHHHPWPTICRVAGTVSQPFVLRLLALMGAALLIARGRRKAAVWLLATMTATGIAGVLLKIGFSRQRPVWADPIQVIGGYSFPSGHAINAAAGAGCVLVLLTLAQARSAAARRSITAVRAGAVLAAFAIGADRVLLGVHYVTDVVAGWAAGALVVLVFWAVFPLKREVGP